MNRDLESMLPEEISDEAAYCLVNFFTELTTILEATYFTKMRRYVEETKPIHNEQSDFINEDF